MKVFCTDSASVVVECQRNFNFLLFKLQSVVLSFYKGSVLPISAKASNQLNCLFSEYGDSIVSVCQLINAIYRRNECLDLLQMLLTRITILFMLLLLLFV
jgi:hypothetical protein